MASRAWAVAAANGFDGVAKWLGPARLRESVDSALGSLKQRAPAVDAQWAFETRAPRRCRERPGRHNFRRRPDQPRPEAEERRLSAGVAGRGLVDGVLPGRRGRAAPRGLPGRRHPSLRQARHRLARPDVFDWPKYLPELIEGFKPTVVIGQFGGNDAQPLELPAEGC